MKEDEFFGGAGELEPGVFAEEGEGVGQSWTLNWPVQLTKPLNQF